MTRSEQRDLLRTYCRMMEIYLMERVERVPEEWNGLQLRNWFWMAAKEQYKHDLGRKEMNAIENEIAVRNL
jgi:hypothetical protein